MEDGSTQQDCHGKGKGSCLHCSMHSDNINEAQKLHLLLEQCTACSHQKGALRQRSIQSMLSAKAFAHWHLCNFKLGLSGARGTKLLFVSKQPPSSNS